MCYLRILLSIPTQPTHHGWRLLSTTTSTRLWWPWVSIRDDFNNCETCNGQWRRECLLDKCPLDKCLLDKCLLDTPFFDRHEVLVKACVDCGEVIYSMVESRILMQVYKDAPRPLSFYFVPLTVTPVYKYCTRMPPGNQISGQIVNLSVSHLPH